MYFFAVTWAILLVGLALHVAVDRHPGRRTGARVLELVAVWFVVAGLGVNGVFAALGHLAPGHDDVARSIGFTPSAFQWEVGVSDLGVGVAALCCARGRFRGMWMSATVLVATIQLWGDGFGHIQQWAGADNHAVNNIWAIPTCFLVPLIAGVATFRLHRMRSGSARADVAPVDARLAV